MMSTFEPLFGDIIRLLVAVKASQCPTLFIFRAEPRRSCISPNDAAFSPLFARLPVWPSSCAVPLAVCSLCSLSQTILRGFAGGWNGIRSDFLR
ncbi:hypothetical protein Y032_0195g1482 [Ancylostoma ceylanicum]|uniref:Uncharacterized protein n=1 Tax=Ancylostoma ceylanicum TaxID=53326 RepID=A0A016SNP7_9BILA|nr:hypothetical protein Y032_0195g1482 [Ancylostoma ceylanicum]